MVFKINTDKMKQKFEEFENKAQGKTSPFVKFSEPGDYNVRAVAYPHSPDPAADPFKEVGVHYLKGIGYFSCPKVNRNDKCHVCEFVWSQVNECESKEEKKPWYKMLPDYYVLVPVLVRGQEDEGVKFFKIRSSTSSMSPNHKKLMKWCMDDKTAHLMDPNSGIDIILTYEKILPSQAAYLKNATVMFQDFALDRDETKFGKKGEYEAFIDTIPDVDKEIFPAKTTADSLEAVKKLAEKMLSTQPKPSDEELNNNNGTTVSANKPKETSSDDLESQLEEMGL